MSMAASLEVRVPLLDLRIVRFAERLPLALKLRDGHGKHLLREAGRKLLPAAVYTHKKQGFSIPLHGWLNAEFFALGRELLGPSTRAGQLFQPAELAATLRDAENAGSDRARVSETGAAARAWVLVLVARWMERFAVSA
jgi:asparagine synthase (glutamine-hydrolysing)